MVRKEDLAYLLIGLGSSAKDIQIKRLKEGLLDKATGDFNSDVVYGKELSLRQLQEKLLFLPFKSEKRLLIIRDAQRLKEEARLFILEYLKSCGPKTVLIFDVDKDNPKDAFLNYLKKYARVYSFIQERPPEVFDLVRQVERGGSYQSLKTLNRLLTQGIKPEFILGALRFVRQQADSLASKKITKLLITCDLEIKTGRLKPSFALEKLVVSLCGFGGFHKLAH